MLPMLVSKGYRDQHETRYHAAREYLNGKLKDDKNWTFQIKNTNGVYEMHH